ncbi:MAG: hypothetical protein AB8H86_26715 [Polyangiales bacterium]
MSTRVLHRLRLLAPMMVFAAHLSNPSSAAAQVRRWRGPPTCNDGDALFARVSAPGLDVEATVSPIEEQLQLRLELRRGDERWHRVVVGDSCEALVEVAMVVVTMAAELQLPQLDAQPEFCEADCPEQLTAPDSVSERLVQRDAAIEAEAALAANADAETDAETEPAANTPESHEPSEVRHSGTVNTASAESPRFEWPEGWSLSGHVGARFDARALPSPRAAVDLGLHLRKRWVRLDIGVLASRIAHIALDDASAELGLAAGRLGACGGTTSGRLWLGGCAAVELGVVRATGRGVDQPRDEGSFWAGLDLGIRGEVGLIGRLSIYLEAGALMPLRRPRFLLQGSVVHTTPAISPRAALGLELRLTR